MTTQIKPSQWCVEAMIEEDTMAFRSKQNDVGIDKEVWIGDMGASRHMTYSREGMTNMQPNKS